MKDFISTELSSTFRSILDTRVKAAIRKKGFDPEDLGYLSEHGRIGVYKGTSTMIIDRTPICCWNEPQYTVTMNGDTVRVDCTFDFKEL